MMKGSVKRIVAVGMSSLAATASMVGVATASTAVQEEGAAPTVDLATSESSQSTAIVQFDTVEGDFAYTQTEVASNEELRRRIGGVAKFLCGSRGLDDSGEALSAEQWTVELRGAVDNPFSATFRELAESDEVQTVVMGCTCAGNPVDGKATANAEVTGVPVLTLLEMAQVREEANTIVFTSADGYSVALPLRYVAQRYCPLVFDVNGAELAESVGGTNQLWLGSTAASYFVRDVTSITLENRQTPPPSPTSSAARKELQALPNIGVLYGGEVR